MNYPKFILNHDWYIETQILGISNKELIHKKGKIFESNENGEYVIDCAGNGKITLSVDKMRSAKDGGHILFTEESIKIKEDLNFEIKELSEDEELEVKKYRIQLDVTTNRKKLREIENFMRKTLEEML